MRYRLSTVVLCIMSVFWLSQVARPDAIAADDAVLFDFASESAINDWRPIHLTEVAEQQPAPATEIASTAKTKTDDGQAKRCLKITFAGGDWPAVGTTTIPVAGNWKPFQTLQAELTV